MYGCVPFRRPVVFTSLPSMPPPTPILLSFPINTHIHSSCSSTSSPAAAMSPPWWQPRWSSLLRFLLLLLHASLLAQSQPQCGTVLIPFPFYLTNATSPLLSDAFSLSCINSSSLFLTVASQSYRVLHFFPDGVLVDFPNTTLCRHYNDLRSFAFSGNQYFAISTDNVLDLYDCEDSSLCKPDCGRVSLMPGCDGRAAGYPSCCYPLSDRSYWRPGNGSSLAAFSQYGCRGFSSWVVSPGSRIGKRGIKLEWAVPANSTACAANANLVNATSVASGVRCQCRDGFSGDGFPVGVGCLKSCFKDGKEVLGNSCYRKKHGRKKAIILAGVLTSTLCVVSLTALFLLKRRVVRPDKFISDSEQSNMISCARKSAACSSRLFTYHELHEATKGFGDDQKIVDSSSATSTLYAGVVMGGSRVAVQRVQCGDSERDLIQVLFRLETLSAVSHRNMARVVGWSIDSACTPQLVVYDYPENGTLRDHLRRARDENEPFDWYRRLNIAAETACVLAFLHHEISPPVHHHDLQSGCIFLDMDFSVRLAGFELLPEAAGRDEESCRRRNDVYGLGLVLLEIVTGNMTTSLQKIKKGKLEEMVDPSLYYHELPQFCREQVEIVADLATRCLLFGGDHGKLGMVDVARELIHIARDTVTAAVDGTGSSLEETFSNSSLLQMISMSPDSSIISKS